MRIGVRVVINFSFIDIAKNSRRFDVGVALMKNNFHPREQMKYINKYCQSISTLYHEINRIQFRFLPTLTKNDL